MHADHTVRDRRDRGIMGHDHHGGAFLTAHVLQNLQDLLAGVVVQRAGRLVAQQDLRILRHSSGDGHTLLFTAGKLRGKIVDTIAETDVFQHFDGILSIGNDLRGELDVFLRGQIRHKIVELEHETDVRPAISRQLFRGIVGNVASVDDHAAF